MQYLVNHPGFGDPLSNYWIQYYTNASLHYIDSKLNNHDQSLLQLRTTNTDLASQITQQNESITNLNDNINTLKNLLQQNTTEIHLANDTIQQTAQRIDTVIIELKNDISLLNTNLTINNTNLENVKNEIKGLASKITQIMSFVPLFVKTTGSYFIRLLTHIKTNTINEFDDPLYDDRYLALLECNIETKNIAKIV